MNRRLALTLAVCALFGARRAAAQDVAIGYQGLPYKVTQDNKTGINLAEGVLLHVGVGAEAGYDSNVFYGSSSIPGAVIGSGILRFNTFGELTNASRSGGTPALTYDFRAGLTYRRYTSSNPNLSSYQNAFMPTAGLSLATTAGTVAFQLSDTYLRQEDPPYIGGVSCTIAQMMMGGCPPAAVAPNAPITRDNNLAAIQAQWSPGGGRISGTLRYTNSLDIFEQSSGFSYANSLTHTLMLDVSWKWLPKTAIFVQANQGYVSYLQDTTPKHPSYPLRVYAGLRGLVTPKLTALVALGYLNGFYSNGATTSGFLGSTYVDLQAIITPSLLNRLTLGYHQDFQNAVIANFYYQYSLYASYVQQIAGRVSADLSVRYSHLDYQGLLFDNSGAERTDNTISAGATIDYFFRSWVYAGVGYSLTADFSDYRLPNSNLPVDYVKHQVFARLGITY
jgi:hypothetical protein